MTTLSVRAASESSITSAFRNTAIPYQAMVAAVRREIPSDVRFVAGVVTELKTSEDLQEVRLSDGRVVEARLIILATGLNGNLVEDLGIGHSYVHKGHTLCVGFTVAPIARADFRFYGADLLRCGVKDRIDYVSFFPMAGAMRANLFSFHNLHDAWSLRLRDAPRETLLATLPKLQRFVGEFEIIDKVKLRTVDLRLANNYRRSGIALIGDAFQTSCPAAGTGITRALTDVDRLCNVYVPHWLQSPGMSAEKICQYYSDPVKQETDAHAYHVSHYRRAITVDTSYSVEAAPQSYRIRFVARATFCAGQPNMPLRLQRQSGPDLHLRLIREPRYERSAEAALVNTSLAGSEDFAPNMSTVSNPCAQLSV